MSSEVFDFKKALEDLKSGKPLSGKDGILTPLVKKLTEEALEAELEHHLNNDNDEENNRGNGKSSKLMKSTSGTFELNAPEIKLCKSLLKWIFNKTPLKIIFYDWLFLRNSYK